MPNVRQDIIQADPRYQDAILGGDDVFVTLPSGQNIRGHLWLSGRDKAPKFLILPGFTEFCEKYAHVAFRMVQMGFDCLIIDWPGQGRSGHLGDDKLAVHCEGFDGAGGTLWLAQASAASLGAFYGRAPGFVNRV